MLPEGMQGVNFAYCEGITGTAESRMSEVLYLFNTFWRPASARPSFLIFLFLSAFLLPRPPLAGDLTQWHLPVGMKELGLRYTKVTGKATSE